MWGTENPLVAIARAHGDALASLGAAAGQHSRSALGFHPATESVHLRTAPPVRLESTLRHETSNSSEENDLPKANCKYISRWALVASQASGEVEEGRFTTEDTEIHREVTAGRQRCTDLWKPALKAEEKSARAWRGEKKLLERSANGWERKCCRSAAIRETKFLRAGFAKKILHKLRGIDGVGT